MRAWLREWYITLRYASPLTRDGRDLRIRVNPDDSIEWVVVPRPE